MWVEWLTGWLVGCGLEFCDWIEWIFEYVDQTGNYLFSFWSLGKYKGKWNKNKNKNVKAHAKWRETHEKKSKKKKW